MNFGKKLVLFFLFICVYSFCNAQIEVARMQTNNFTAFGLGSFVNFGIPVNEKGAVSIEGGFYYFTNGDNNVAIAPVIAGYRQLLSKTNYGWYLEPAVGYTFGGSDIQKYDANGVALNKPDGNQLDQLVNGPTACINFGYLFEATGRIRFNIALRYQHIFPNGDPGINVISLRVSHSFSFGRRIQ